MHYGGSALDLDVIYGRSPVELSEYYCDIPVDFCGEPKLIGGSKQGIGESIKLKFLARRIVSGFFSEGLPYTYALPRSQMDKVLAAASSKAGRPALIRPFSAAVIPSSVTGFITSRF